MFHFAARAQLALRIVAILAALVILAVGYKEFFINQKAKEATKPVEVKASWPIAKKDVQVLYAPFPVPVPYAVPKEVEVAGKRKELPPKFVGDAAVLAPAHPGEDVEVVEFGRRNKDKDWRLEEINKRINRLMDLCHNTAVWEIEGLQSEGQYTHILIKTPKPEDLSLEMVRKIKLIAEPFEVLIQEKGRPRGG